MLKLIHSLIHTTHSSLGAFCGIDTIFTVYWENKYEYNRHKSVRMGVSAAFRGLKRLIESSAAPKGNRTCSLQPCLPLKLWIQLIWSSVWTEACWQAWSTHLPRCYYQPVSLLLPDARMPHFCSSVPLSLSFFGGHAGKILVLSSPQSGIQSESLAVKGRNPNHWTSREVPVWLNLIKVE